MNLVGAKLKFLLIIYVLLFPMREYIKYIRFFSTRAILRNETLFNHNIFKQGLKNSNIVCRKFTAKSQTKQLSYPMIEDVRFRSRFITSRKLNILDNQCRITNCKYHALRLDAFGSDAVPVPVLQPQKKFSDFFKIGVDKRKKMCYNRFCCEGVAQLVRVPA